MQCCTCVFFFRLLDTCPSAERSSIPRPAGPRILEYKIQVPGLSVNPTYVCCNDDEAMGRSPLTLGSAKS